MKLSDAVIKKIVLPFIVITFLTVFAAPGRAAGPKVYWENKCTGGGQSFHVQYYDVWTLGSYWEHVLDVATGPSSSGSYQSHDRSSLAVITAVMYQIAGSGAKLDKKTIYNVPFCDASVVMDTRSGQCDIYQK
jgi:hypothetical protein